MQISTKTGVIHAILSSFHFPRSFLYWRAFGLGFGNRPLRGLSCLACLTAFRRVSPSQFSSLLYFCSLLTFSHDLPPFLRGACTSALTQHGQSSATRQSS